MERKSREENLQLCMKLVEQLLMTQECYDRLVELSKPKE